MKNKPVLEVSGSTHHRAAYSNPPILPPSAAEDWEALRSRSVSELRQLGLRPWDAADRMGRVLMLFPCEWYAHIPDGFLVCTISGKEEAFERGKTDDDRRFGMLPYGVRVPKGEKP